MTGRRPYHRAGFRGRSMATGRVPGHGRSPRPPTPDPIPEDLGELVQIISKDDLAQTEARPTSLQDVEAVASFNWLDGQGRPTIAIPGAPPRWTPPSKVPTLSEDSGIYYRDINAAHFPNSPLKAVALAILANKDISTSSIDLMACAFSLQSLFLFTRGARKTFRIMVKAVEGTVFLIRREGSPSEVIPNVRGYGHSMPEAYTTWHHDIKGSVSNQRVIRYTFAGLDCLLRYEPDGYLPDKLDPDVLALMTQDSEIVPTTADIALEVQMQDAKLTSSQVQPAEADLHVEKAGIHIPQAATFELKTRSFKRKEEHFFEEFALRLWLTQTPYFILAFHTYGSFDDIRIRDVRSDVAIWESKNQPDIKRFAGLLQQIVRRARAESGGTLELWRHESGDLEVRKPPGELYGALPLDLEDLWVEDSEGGIAVH